MAVNRRELGLTLAAAGAVLPLLANEAGAVAIQTGALTGLGGPSDLTLAEASRRIRRGELTPSDLVRACLARIDAINPRVNAVITAMRAQALALAAVLDAEARAGQFRSPLHGIPVALKDNIDTGDAPTTNASNLWKGHIPAQDARVVQQLKQAGAIIIAKANMAEFAISPTNATSAFGPVRNPRNLDYVSGGSSGGSAAAVASGMCMGALGTDSGGSVRLPSAWCGTVGLKPTRGVVPTTGVGPGLPLLDTTGPIARTAEDVALLFEGMAGYDPRDPSSVERPCDYDGKPKSLSSLRIGVPRQRFYERLDPRIAQAVEAALPLLAGLVKSVQDVSFRSIEFPEGIYTGPDIVAGQGKSWPARAADYQPRSRVILQSIYAALNDPKDGSAAQKLGAYAKTVAMIERQQRTIDSAFDGFDLIVLPTMKTMPPTVAAAVKWESSGVDPDGAMVNIENTMTFNLLGLPALSLPCGVTREGLPIGLMLAGPRFSEPTLLHLGAAYEKARGPWQERRFG